MKWINGQAPITKKSWAEALEAVNLVRTGNSAYESLFDGKLICRRAGNQTLISIKDSPQGSHEV